MPHLRRVLVALAVVVGTIVVAAPAGAVTPPPSLVGEQLFAGPDSSGGQGLVLATFTCKADQSGEIRFSATGVAVGPYPGTFIETGTVTVGPGTLTGAGPVATLTTDFEITSGTTLITGTKTLLVALTNEGACASFASDSYDVFFVSQVSYTATIKLSATSVFQDTGTGSAVGRSAAIGGFLFAVQQPEGPASLFEESYETSNGVVPLAGPGKVTGGGWILGPTLTNQVSFGFEAQTNPNGLHASCTLIDHAAKLQIKCKSIDTLVVTGTHATFTGTATFDKVITRYQIDVDDLGEPGTSDTFRIVLGNGYAAGGTMIGGNIQIHKE